MFLPMSANRVQTYVAEVDPRLLVVADGGDIGLGLFNNFLRPFDGSAVAAESHCFQNFGGARTQAFA